MLVNILVEFDHGAAEELDFPISEVVFDCFWTINVLQFFFFLFTFAFVIDCYRFIEIYFFLSASASFLAK